MTKALLFPGQGSQIVGMGLALYQNFPCAREVFEEVDAALSSKLSSVIFEGPQDILTMTENAQPAIMATSIAAFRVMQRELGIDLARDITFVAGHSLGEYSALCAAGALNLTETARLLRIRGQAMQKAVPAGRGAMAALLGADREIAEAIVSDAAQNDICCVANDNAPGQVVISGTRLAVERAIDVAKERGIKRAVLLEVSAPFHSPLMAPASGVMAEALSAATIMAPIVPVVANVTAKAERDPATIRQLLVDQVTGVVRWRESIEYMQSQGIECMVEVGAGKVLSGLNKRIAPTLLSLAVGTPEDIEAFAKAA